MKKHITKKFGVSMAFALGSIAAFIISILMVTGDLEKVIKFGGIGEEIVFTLFAILLGIIFLGGAVSNLLQKD